MKMKVQRKAPGVVVWGVAKVAKVGEMVVGLTEKGEVCRASFMRGRDALEVVERWEREWPATKFEVGKVRKDWKEGPLLLVGTDFQARVWKEITKIKAGEVLTYGEVALKVDQPRAARGVGTACGLGLVAFVVPYHRVVSANGIGGYGPDGIAFKRKLLKLEGVVKYGND